VKKNQNVFSRGLCLFPKQFITSLGPQTKNKNKNIGTKDMSKKNPKEILKNLLKKMQVIDSQ
jgi:hypothetical protein